MDALKIFAPVCILFENDVILILYILCSNKLIHTSNVLVIVVCEIQLLGYVILNLLTGIYFEYK